MKKKIDINTIFMTTLLLFLICSVMTAALAGTNIITKDKIAALSEESKNLSLREVISADSYNEKIIKAPGIDGGEELTDVTYYEAVSGGKTVGYIVVAASKGYGGDVEVMTGVTPDLKVAKIKVLSADDETPGLGQNATKKDFAERFVGKTLDIKIKNGENSIDALTGATYTSKAVVKDVNFALSTVQYVINNTAGSKDEPDVEPEEEVELLDETDETVPEPEENSEGEETVNE